MSAINSQINASRRHLITQDGIRQRLVSILSVGPKSVLAGVASWPMIDLNQLEALAGDLRTHLGLAASVVAADPHDIIVIDTGGKQVGLWFHPKRGYAGCDVTPICPGQTIEDKPSVSMKPVPTA